MRFSEIEERMDLLLQAFNSMSNGVVVIGKEGEVLVANKSALSLLSLDDSVIGRSFGDALPDSHLFMRETDSQHQAEAMVTLRDGANRLFGFTNDKCGVDGSRVIVFRDITALAENKRQRRRAEELALAGEMLCRLSHEIKNPLASIVIGVKTLQRDTQRSSHHGIVLQLLSEEVDSLTTIVNNLLDSARPRRPSFRPVRVEPMLERCVYAQELVAVRRGVRLELLRRPASPAVIVDDQAMLSVLESLIQNALDACSKGDVVRIGWRELNYPERDELVPGFPGKVAAIFVKDSGSGIPDEVSSSGTGIFRAFVSTKTSGSGLGLAVSRDIVESHGGLIIVDSRPNRGTEAKILLPLPSEVHCWKWNKDRALDWPSGNLDCRGCEVRSSGVGFCCWALKGRDYREATGRWPECCVKCGYFRSSSLTPFFRSRLTTSKRA